MKKLVFLLILSMLASVAAAQTGKAGGVPEANLKGRSVVGTLPSPHYDVREDCTVAVRIWVDQFGTVTKAVAGADGTTVTDNGIWNAARNAAMGAHFNQSVDAPVLQEGTITYVFTPAEDPDPFELKEGPSQHQPSEPEETITFRGVPVDGDPLDMIDALKELGFRERYRNELEGEFNGEDVELIVHTHQGVVDRIQVDFPGENDETLRVKYNNLISRFGRSGKYVTLVGAKEIPAGEGIKDELVTDKYYCATYFQLKEGTDAETWKAMVTSRITKAAGVPVSRLSHEELEERLNELPDDINSPIMGIVWFYIKNDLFLRNIRLFYDNFWNRPRGEDL